VFINAADPGKLREIKNLNYEISSRPPFSSKGLIIRAEKGTTLGEPREYGIHRKMTDNRLIIESETERFETNSGSIRIKDCFGDNFKPVRFSILKSYSVIVCSVKSSYYHRTIEIHAI
jgi:hypothetical protein